MESKVRIAPNVSRALVLGLVLGVVSWVVSGYLFPRQSNRYASGPLADGSSDADKPLPQLLPNVEVARPLRPSGQISLTSNPTDMLTPDRQASAEIEPDLQFPSSTGDSAPAAESAVDQAYPEITYPSTDDAQYPMTEIPYAASDEPYPTTDTPFPAMEMPYPVTNTPAGVKIPEKTPLAETPQTGASSNEPEAALPPATPPTIRAVEPLKRNPMPALQTMTMPNLPERKPVENEQCVPSQEPEVPQAARQPALPARSEQLESIARQADQLIRHGFELAGRKAYFAARAEFIAALRLVAQGLDTDEQTISHGKSLAAASTALKEAEDFIPRGSMLEANLDIPALVASHTTPALKNADTSQTTSLSALKSYLTYAQEQFAAAAGREISGSMALRALGKLHDELGQHQNTDIQAAAPKAVVFYQAALLVAPQNYMAANDLGVLLARAGNLRDARAVLEHSAANGYQSTVLRNLATVYQKQGRSDLAAQANQRAMLAQQTEQARRQAAGALAANGSVQWVAPNAFAQTSPNLASGSSQAGNQAVRPQTGGIVRQTPQARPATNRPTANSYSANNPYLKSNNRQSAANSNQPATQSQSPVMGQTPKGDYQR